MSNFDAFLYLSDYEKSMLYFEDDSRRCAWMEGLLSRFRVEFEEQLDLEWIVAYALCLYLKQESRGRLPALACVCIACKQLDDESWEIGSGDYEKQIPHCTAKQLACMERVILTRLDFRTIVSQEKIERTVVRRMIEAGLACTI